MKIVILFLMLMVPGVLTSRTEKLDNVNVYDSESKRRRKGGEEEAEDWFYELEKSALESTCVSTIRKEDGDNADDVQSKILKLTISDVQYGDGDIPIGYRFKPTDQQLLHYLKQKAWSETLPNKKIHEICASTFFKTHPKDLVSDFSNNMYSNNMYEDSREWYFYVRHDSEEFYKKPIRETTLDGFPYIWKTDVYYEINDVKDDIIGKVIGYKFVSRLFRNQKKTIWRMEEYRANWEFDSTTTNWTLARLKKGVEY